MHGLYARAFSSDLIVRIRSFCIAFACLLLSGCIVVDDFGNYWNKGFIDSCVNAIVLPSLTEDADTSAEAHEVELRSIQLGTHTFLMIRDHPGDPSGNMIRYNIDKNEYVSYRLNETKREDFLHYYPDSGIVLTSETATIPELNVKTATLLATIADDPSYWLEASRDPYNPGHRPDCIRQLPKKP